MLQRTPPFSSWWVAPLSVLLGGASLHAAEPDAATFFEQRVRPLLVEACLGCHGAKKQESGLRLDGRGALLKGGESGPAVVPGKPQESLLIKAVRHQGEVRMPPRKRLSDAQVADLARWVELGAPWPGAEGVPIRGGDITAADREFWSFRPVKPPPLPAVKDTAWARSPVDRFILAGLEAKGLIAVAPADRRTLIRRATYDLTGLPPTPEEVDAFLKDDAPDAYEKVVNRLLASPAYGERWGRHWLDVVRYADTAGETADYPVREAYRYRNYVIDAFNRDKPYDQFLREQLAGDILARSAPREQYAELVTATGYLAISRRFGFDPQNYQHLTIQDTIDTVGQSVLGLSLGCARCHHHKFDPVNTADYYALYGIFASSTYAFPGSEEVKRPRDFAPLVPPAEAGPLRQSHEAEVAKLAAEAGALQREKTAAEAALKMLREGTNGAQLPADPAALDELKAKVGQLTARWQEAERRRAARAAESPYPVAYAVTEGKPHNVRIHKRGEPDSLGDEVPRRFLTILGGAPLPPDEGSGRLQLAQWLTDSRNPLTARVMVNRIWQHHFGAGLVDTPNDFGARGRRPTHPELLDFLADQFVAGGWSIKALHRLMMLSATYQLGSATHPENPRLDPENAGLWRQRRQRLQAEAIRDALLLLGGTLDRTPGEAHPFPPTERWGFTQHAPFVDLYDSKRRSVYLMTPRLKRHPFLALFDGPDPNATTPTRNITTVPTQALFLMNDAFVHEQSLGFAKRLLAASAEDEARIKRAYAEALARPPSAAEMQAGLTFLERYRSGLAAAGVLADDRPAQAWAGFARTLLTRNEFLFVD
jgi:Protein of unknown function (DUF1553)/Protein of unknown function (DUF1549)/Planctomycete cytochrome C